MYTTHNEKIPFLSTDSLSGSEEDSGGQEMMPAPFDQSVFTKVYVVQILKTPQRIMTPHF